MFLKVFMFSFLLLLNPVLHAQSTSPSKINEVKLESDPLNKKLNIAFSTEKEIHNLLVVITDSTGQTVFLDNRYRFKGNYKHSVDFKEYHKGWYLVQIIGDDEKINKKVDVK